MTTSYLLAGFGGQGILFSGKLLAYKGLTDGLNVSWLPSYGPEMRGGTANCSVILSDEPIGAPIVIYPDVLVAMNLPSLDKYEDSVVPGGMIYVDSSLIERKVRRTDVNVCYIPATKAAAENGLDGLANMIIAGKLIADSVSTASGQSGAGLKDSDNESLNKALSKCISARHADLLEKNRQALVIGSRY